MLRSSLFLREAASRGLLILLLRLKREVFIIVTVDQSDELLLFFIFCVLVFSWGD